MKIFLFTHSQDIDGLGCCFLAKQAFNNVEFELWKNVFGRFCLEWFEIRSLICYNKGIIPG